MDIYIFRNLWLRVLEALIGVPGGFLKFSFTYTLHDCLSLKKFFCMFT